MSFKKNVYIVLTEYQFLQAVNIATTVYSGPENINTIYLVRNGQRLMAIDNQKSWSFKNLQVKILDNENIKKVAELILNEKPSHFLFFQAISALNVHLAHTLSRQGVEISLGPDGYGTYGTFNKKYHLLSIIRDSYKENLRLYKSKLFTGKIHRFDYYTYGNQQFIDNLWITHPEQYNHRAKNKVNILKLPDFNKQCIDFVKSCFNFDEGFPTKDAIYFFNQPLWGKLIELEYDFMKEVATAFPNRQIVVKLHPLTNPKWKLKFKELNGVQIIESSAPAEVLLISLENCIVYSGWSSVLITENRNCNYYFNFPIFKELNDHVLNQIDLLPLDHIRMIKSPKEMTFPNG